MKIAIIGDPSLGGVQMRGVAVAKLLGWPFIDVREYFIGRYDVLVLVKYARGRDRFMRGDCDRLIFDPLDCWKGINAEPEIFWRHQFERLKPDDVLATTKCADYEMSWGMNKTIMSHVAPHHCDPRLIGETGDPRGPVVYCGAFRYIERAARNIEASCRKLGKEFICTDDPLKQIGASLLLHPRLPPHDYPLNRLCKPQVKLENAAALGVPVLATDDPCVTTCRDVPTLPAAEWFGPGLVDALERALKSPPLTEPVTLEMHCARLKSIVESGA